LEDGEVSRRTDKELLGGFGGVGEDRWEGLVRN